MKKAAQNELEWLELFVDFAQGDPLLTAWEEQFVASMRAFRYRRGAYAGLDWNHRLSSRQFDICHQIEDKLLAASLRSPVSEDAEIED